MCTYTYIYTHTYPVFLEDPDLGFRIHILEPLCLLRGPGARDEPLRRHLLRPIPGVLKFAGCLASGLQGLNMESQTENNEHA